MRSDIALLSIASLLALSLPAVSAAPTPEPAACAGEVCDAINAVCERAFGASCVGLAAAEDSGEPVRCMGVVCKTINQVCIRVLGAACLG